jgi:hypothetical protein
VERFGYDKSQITRGDDSMEEETLIEMEITQYLQGKSPISRRHTCGILTTMYCRDFIPVFSRIVLRPQSNGVQLRKSAVGPVE